MSYGTPSDVAALARVWTTDGEWIDPIEDYAIRGTNPTLATVETWLENLSAQMDLALQANWFPTPVPADTTAYKAIAQYVCSLAADLAYQANGVEREVSPQGKILKDMSAWVEANADGFVAGGLTQTPTPSVKNQASVRVIGTFT